MKKVCIDPGHGGKDPGGCGNGLQEKDLVLDIGLKCTHYLMSRGASVLLTRNKDVFIPISHRYQMANAFGADAFVSIHTDAFYESAHGFSILYRDTHTRMTFGEIMKRELTAVHDDFRGYQYRTNVGVLNHTDMPALLTENLFVTHFNDALLLGDPNFREKLAIAHSNAICEFLGIHDEFEEKEGEIMIPSPVQKNHVFPDIWQNHFKTYYLHCKNESPKKNTFKVLVTEGSSVNTEPIATFSAGGFQLESKDLKSILRDKYAGKSVCVTVQSSELSAVYIREA